MWAKTLPDRVEWMPLDFEPAENGNVLVFPAEDNPRLLVAQVVGKRSAAAMRAGGWLLFVHHRLSCAYTDQWSRGPKAMRPKPTGARTPPPSVDTADPEPQEGLF